MIKYKVTFIGRKINAIGIFYPITEYFETQFLYGSREFDDRLYQVLYAKYEHIQNLKIVNIK